MDLLAQRREGNELVAMAADLNLCRRLNKPARVIAEEMQQRARVLRSKRSSRGSTKQLELQLVDELDAVEAEARRVDALERSGTAGKAELEAAHSLLALVVFAARVRFEDLMQRQDLPYGLQAQPQSEADRKREQSQESKNSSRARSSARRRSPLDFARGGRRSQKGGDESSRKAAGNRSSTKGLSRYGVALAQT